MANKQTLRDQLAATRAKVTADDFAASKNLDPRQGASWAIWGSTTDDLSVFENLDGLLPRLRKDVVLIGANFAFGGKPGSFAPFQNFHAAHSRGDSKLRKGIEGSVLEGAFLTDLVKDYPTKDATGLAADIISGKIDTLRHVVAGFEAEQRALGLSADTLYIPMGGETRRLWDLLVEMGAIADEQRVFHREYGSDTDHVLNLTHYSAAVNMSTAVEVLLRQPRLT